MLEGDLKICQASELSQMHVRTFSTAAVSDYCWSGLQRSPAREGDVHRPSLRSGQTSEFSPASAVACSTGQNSVQPLVSNALIVKGSIILLNSAPQKEKGGIKETL